MNAKRREALNKIYSEMEDIIARLETIRDEEQEAYDNMPDSLKESERGQASEQAVSALDNALSGANETLNGIEEAANV